MHHDNGSGRGSEAVIPAEIRRWNWGAFLLNWIWGLGNSTPLALLCFVPFVGVVMPIVLGIKGSEWAWRNKYWSSVEQFQATQRRWAIVGFSLFAGVLVLCGAVGYGAFRFLKSGVTNEIYPVVAHRLNQTPAVLEKLGSPVVVEGFPMGKFEVAPTSGTVDVAATVRGPKGTGKVYIVGEKSMGEWTLSGLRVETSDGVKIPVLETKAL